MPPRFNVLWLNRLRISNHLSVLETLSHFFEKNLSNIQSKTSCFSAYTMGEWIHVGPALNLFLCSLSSLELPSGLAVLFPVPRLLSLLWLITTEVSLSLTILLSFPWPRHLPAIPGKSLALHYPVWSEPMGPFEYLYFASLSLVIPGC